MHIICQDLQHLDIQVITSPTLRLDLPADAEALLRTVQELQPRLLILDSIVRLHRIDENASREVAPLLAYLRELQRRHTRSTWFSVCTPRRSEFPSSSSGRWSKGSATGSARALLPKWPRRPCSSHRTKAVVSREPLQTLPEERSLTRSSDLEPEPCPSRHDASGRNASDVQRSPSRCPSDRRGAPS